MLANVASGFFLTKKLAKELFCLRMVTNCQHQHKSSNKHRENLRCKKTNFLLKKTQGKSQCTATSIEDAIPYIECISELRPHVNAPEEPGGVHDQRMQDVIRREKNPIKF
jgi:hypothetical protein